MTDLPQDPARQNLTDQINAHPALVVAGGLALGVLASALLPKGSARRLAKGVAAAAVAGSEAGRAFARHAAEEASERIVRVGEKADHLRHRATAAGGNAANGGLDIARAAIRLLGSLRR